MRRLKTILKESDNLIPITFVVIFISYLIYFIYINNGSLIDSNFPYYSWLLESILHGFLNVEPKTTIDLSFFNNKWYLNWGPAPILYILFYKLLFGAYLSDKIYTFLTGIFNIEIFYFLIKEFIKYFRLHISKISILFMILFFSFASPNFYTSMGGRIWLTEQIVAVFFILTSLLFTFKYLNTSNFYFFFISTIFLNLSWLTRAPMIFYALIPIFILYKSKNDKDFRKLFITFFGTGAVFLLVFFFYNFLRFGNILDTGLIHHIGNPRYEDVLSKGKIFSVDFITYNFYYFFLNIPQISLNPINLKINLEGESVFLFYPLTLFLIVFIKKYILLIRTNFFVRGAFLVILFETILLLMYFATGWTQAGYRYFFDLIPLTFLLTVFVIERVKKEILIALLFIGAFLNIYAATIFFRF